MKKLYGLVLIACLCMTGCNVQPTGGGEQGLEEDPGRPKPVVEENPFEGMPPTVFLSSDRTVLIRQDVKEGDTVVTARASEPVTFAWSNNAPGLVDVVEHESIPEPIVTTNGITTNGIISGSITVTAASDPGPAGRTVTIQVTATDADGLATTETMSLRILRPPGALAVSVSADRTRVPPGGSVDLTASIRGGEPDTYDGDEVPCPGPGTNAPQDAHPPYNILWTVNEDLGLTAAVPDLSVACLQQADGVTQSTATYQAPIAVGPVVFTVEARDATGNRIAASTTVTVASANELTVTASGEGARVQPNSATDVTAMIRGGTAPFTVCFGATVGTVDGGEAGCGPLDGLTNCTCDVGNASGATIVRHYTAPGQKDTDIITVQVSDAVGAQTSTSFSLEIVSDAVAGGGGGQGTISLSLSAERAVGLSDTEPCLSETVTINTATTGGSGGEDFTWSIVGEALDGEKIEPAADGRSAEYTAPSETASSRTIEVYVEEVGGSHDDATIVMVIDPGPDCTITADEVCEDQTGNGASVPSAGLGATYLWNVTTNGTLVGTNGLRTVTFDAGSNGPAVLQVTVTNANTCEDTCTEEVAVNANPEAAITAADVVPPDSTGNMASVVDAGVGADYAWTIGNGTITAGADTDEITYTAETVGTVTLGVTVTTAKGCSDTDSKLVTIGVAPTVIITADDPVCAESTGNAASVPLFSPPALSYVWDITGGTITTGHGTNEITYTAGTGSTVEIQVTVVDSTSVTHLGTKSVTVNDNPDATITADEVCAGSTGNTASVPDAGVGATYAWTITGGTIVGPDNTYQITYTAGTGASVTLGVTVTDILSCSSTGSKVVAVTSSPDVTITPNPDEVCEGSAGNTASVPDAGAGATYAWTIEHGTIVGPDDADQITYTAWTNESSVTLGVTIEDAAGCTATGGVVVPINDNPDATITAEDDVDPGSTGNTASVLSAGPGAEYVWTISGGAATSGQGTPVLIYTAGMGVSLTLGVTVTTVKDCSDTDSKLVTIGDPPIVTITADDPVCAESTGNAASVPLFSPPALSYVWDVTGGTIATGHGTNEITYTAGTGPTVTIDVTVVDSSSVTHLGNTSVTVNDNPDATISADEVCAGSMGNTASVPDAGVGADYAWTIVGGTIVGPDDADQITYTAGTGASVTLGVTIVDDNLCTALGEIVVPVNDNPDATITADPVEVCEGSEGNTASVPYAGLGADYAWTITDGTIVGLDDTDEITYTAGTGVSVTLGVTIVDDNMCTALGQIVVPVNDNPDTTLTLTPDVVCPGSVGNIAQVPSAGPGAAYVWTIANGNISSGQGTPFINYTAGDPGTNLQIDVDVTTLPGCVGSNGTGTIPLLPEADIVADTEVCEGSTGNTASVADAGVGADYAWTITGGTIVGPDDANQITYTAGAGPTVELGVTVTDSDLCADTDTTSVTVVTDASCDNGVFCDGAETCVAGGVCTNGTYPCTANQWCDEVWDGCIAHGGGDFEPDSDIDLADFAEFQMCFDQDIVSGSSCEPANMTGTDGKIDLDDYAEFVAVLSGP